MRDMIGKVILITGGATGLGAAIALGATKRGARAVIINCTKSLKEAEITAGNIRAAGADAIVAQGDVAVDADCRRIAAVVEQYGVLHALVNNAGITRHVAHGTMEGLTKEDFLDLYAVNTVGPFQMIRACRPLLEASGQSSVVMTSSIAGVSGIGSSVAYAASKGALNTMTLSLARALAPKIRVNAICPGFIDTRWTSDRLGEVKTQAVRDDFIKRMPLQVASTAEDIADAALFFVSDASRSVTGATMLADAGWHLSIS